MKTVVPGKDQAAVAFLSWSERACRRVGTGYRGTKLLTERIRPLLADDDRSGAHADIAELESVGSAAPN